MKAIVLSAGQGRRLLPLTADTPKCTLPLNGKALIEWQIDALLSCGIEQVSVVVGYGAEKVEQLLQSRYGSERVQAIYNPFYEVADNLASCWIAREAMAGDFLILNGDTLFEPAILRRLLESQERPITVTIDQKAEYDADDMKVSMGKGGQLLRIGKGLASSEVNGESIGMLLFRGEGAALFRSTIEASMRKPLGLKQWYLSVIDQLAPSGLVWTSCIRGRQWAEVDYPADYRSACEMVEEWDDRSDAWQPVAAKASKLARLGWSVVS